MRLLAAALAVLTSGLVPEQAKAFRNVAVGSAIPNRSMPALDGRRLPLLEDGRINVVVFVRTGQDHSASALHQLAQLERELEGRPVRFVAVASDTDARDDLRAMLQASGARLPLLVDEADGLYGELGVKMHPCAGVFGTDRRLVGFQPFRKINYLDAMRGQVRLALGEIDQAALASILDPGAAPPASGAGRARARLKLARTLLATGSVEGAIENARAGIALEPDLADAHLALAEALARGGRCDESAREVVTARRLSPGADVPTPACAARSAGASLPPGRDGGGR